MPHQSLSFTRGTPGTESRSAGPIIALAIAYIALAMVLVWNSEALGANAVPLIVIGSLCTYPVIRAWRSRHFDIFEPIWAYVALFFIEYFVKPMLVFVWPHLVSFNFFPIDYFTPSSTAVLFMASVGLVAFYTGYWSRWTSSVADHLPSCSDDWSPKKQLLLSAAMLSAFYFIVFFFFAGRAGFSLEYMYENRVALMANAGDLGQLMHLLGWAGVILAARFVLGSRISNRVAKGVAFSVILASVIVAFSLFGSRWSMLFIPATLLIAHHYSVRRFSLLPATCAAAALFISSALLGAYRSNMRVQDISPQHFETNLVDEINGYMSFDILLGIYQFYPENHPYYHGELAAGSLIWLIPRRFWPGKPTEYGPSIIQDDIAPGLRMPLEGGGYTGTMISQSTMGEGFADFGVAGALSAMFLFGLAWGSLYAYMRRHRFNYPSAAIFGVIMIGMPVYIRGFSSPLTIMGIWFAVAIATFRAISVRKQPHSRAAETLPAVA